MSWTYMQRKHTAFLLSFLGLKQTLQNVVPVVYDVSEAECTQYVEDVKPL